MAIRQSKYAFSEIVKDKEDPLQLLAYAIYKADKSEIAEQLNNAQRSPQEIEDELQNFHDAVIHSQGLHQSYHARANKIGEALFATTEAAIKAQALQDFVERVLQIQKQEETWQHKLGKFFSDAIKGVLSTVVVIIIFSGVYSIFLTKEERDKLFNAAGQTIINTINGDLPVVDAYRNELKKPTLQQAPQSSQTAPANPVNPQNNILPPNFNAPAGSGTPGVIYPTTPPQALPPLPDTAPAR